MKQDLWSTYLKTAEEFRPLINIALLKQHKTGIHVVTTFCLLWKYRLQLIILTSLAHQIRPIMHLNRWVLHGAKQSSRTRACRITFTDWFKIRVRAQPAEKKKLVASTFLRNNRLHEGNSLLLHHHHHVQQGLGLIHVNCILKMKLVPPSLPRSSYVS